ncbi:hypothetical protein DFH08DRAFT_243468 [Mycena albidolilacea]|uniref:Uncharacterized protein n=1 Tax=Mycena albidolilacea TaxID=1033008 RepID=A0AAD7ENF5_9AGAR|nr:hypothetical protein DFH08DRAFT_243468 [Mycena albidolilacea]
MHGSRCGHRRPTQGGSDIGMTYSYPRQWRARSSCGTTTAYNNLRFAAFGKKDIPFLPPTELRPQLQLSCTTGKQRCGGLAFMPRNHPPRVSLVAWCLGARSLRFNHKKLIQSPDTPRILIVCTRGGMKLGHIPANTELKSARAVFCGSPVEVSRREARLVASFLDPPEYTSRVTDRSFIPAGRCVPRGHLWAQMTMWRSTLL